MKLNLKGEDGARYGGFGNKSVIVAVLLSSSALALIRNNANAQVLCFFFFSLSCHPVSRADSFFSLNADS